MLKLWIALKARSNWPVKLRISFAIYLREQLGKECRPGLHPWQVLEIIQINFLWCILSHCFIQYIPKKN